MNLTLGVAAHVDAGKTTLCEQLLRRAGVIRACGRVDHGDAFMDDDPMERARGITIFTEQATLSWPVSGGEPLFVTLMDTPGHVDFSGEMERALSVLDAALLVVSCAEGVQSHTVTLFRLLQKRKIPTIIFLNKTDREGADIARVTAQMRRLLSGDCVLMAGDVRWPSGTSFCWNSIWRKPRRGRIIFRARGARLRPARFIPFWRAARWAISAWTRWRRPSERSAGRITRGARASRFPPRRIACGASAAFDIPM